MGYKQSKSTFPIPSIKIKDVVIPLKKIIFLRQNLSIKKI